MLSRSSVRLIARKICGANAEKQIPIATRLFSTSNKDETTSPSTKSDIADDAVLFRGSSELLIRGLFGASVFNLMYWSVYVTQNLASYNLLFGEGAPPVADSTLGAIGSVCTFLLFGATYGLSRHYIRRIYLPENKNHIGFQTYNMLGNAGRRIETVVGNAKFTGKKGDAKTGDSYLRIGGVNSHFVLSSNGIYVDKERLNELMSVVPSNETPMDREAVTAWLESRKKDAK